MKYLKNVAMLTLVLALAGAAQAQPFYQNVGDPADGRQDTNDPWLDDVVDESQTWTNDKVYVLRDQIYVLDGVTLTIEPGTVILGFGPDDVATGRGGALIITRGAKLIAQGEPNAPIIFTSNNDFDTWPAGGHAASGKDLKNHAWRETCQEWGNLVIMGRALVSDGGDTDSPAGNTEQPTGDNISPMEGLLAETTPDPLVFFGGGNAWTWPEGDIEHQDNDDSGTIHHIQLRYGGKVVGQTNELNGLSLGGLGRGTDMHHISIMNNVDDGIEIWGGTFNLKYFEIWNIGDDSFDLDAGWRGKAQFGLIVQGYSIDTNSGGGVCDNAIEHDGAEDDDAQPVTTITCCNLTVIGQPAGGDNGTEWRDNCRVQYRNCLFMGIGGDVIKNKGTDGEDGRTSGSAGYGKKGTLTWAQCWNTAYTHSHDWTATVNALTPEPATSDFRHPVNMYQAQSQGDPSIGQGMLCEITDTVFYNNLGLNLGGGDPYAEANAVGVTIAGGTNGAKKNVVAANQPIVDITYSIFDEDADGNPGVTKGGREIYPVINLDPRAANSATNSYATAPVDGFFTPAPYRGAFSPTYNWLEGWSASDAIYRVVDGVNEPLLSSPANPPAPAAPTLEMTASLFFATVAGRAYTVEEAPSPSGPWSPVGTLIGDGTVKAVTDLEEFDSGKFYRLINQ